MVAHVTRCRHPILGGLVTFLVLLLMAPFIADYWRRSLIAVGGLGRHRSRS